MKQVKKTKKIVEEKSAQKWWLLPLCILAGGLVLAAGILGYSKFTADKTPTSFKCSGAQASQFSCYKQTLKDVTQKQGPEKAFVILKKSYNTSSYVQSQCHQLTHVIGQTAATKYPDVGSAYLHGDNFCWSGYYHGVMQGIAAKVGIDNLKKGANSICAGVAAGTKRYGFDHFNCVHGLGHGFMGIQSNELFVSLKTCDVLNDSWERQSCYGGVFMENVMAYQSADSSTKYLNATEPLYPCTAVDDAYKSSCYLMQTSHALTLVNDDFGKVFQICSTIPEHNYQLTCYQSLGRDASGQSNSQVEPTKQRCLLGQNQEAQDNCVIGAVKDFISYFHGMTEAKAFCASLPTELGQTCTTNGDAYYKIL